MRHSFDQHHNGERTNGRDQSDNRNPKRRMHWSPSEPHSKPTLLRGFELRSWDNRVARNIESQLKPLGATAGRVANTCSPWID